MIRKKQATSKEPSKTSVYKAMDVHNNNNNNKKAIVETEQ